MQVYNVGPDDCGEDLDKELPSNTQTVIYSYEYGNYDGDGTMLVQIDNKWYLWNMGHCSCYGPLGDYGESIDFSKEHAEDPHELVEKLTEPGVNNYQSTHDLAVGTKLKELLDG